MASPSEHFDLCIDVLRWAVRQGWCDVAAPEVDLDGAVADVLALGDGQIRIIEVKRTRADLLADLRARKMVRKYPPRSTHCALALGPDVIDGRSSREVLAELEALGLPASWGVLRICPGKSWGADSIRAVRRHGDQPEGRHRAMARALGRSLVWRVVRSHQGGRR